MIPLYGTVGLPLTKQADGVVTTLRQGSLGDLIMSELQARFYESNYRGKLFSAGMGLTSIASALFTSATLDATGKPIVGVWNPSNSGKNVILLAAYLGLTITAATNTGGGPFVWSSSIGNTAISTGAAAFNRLTGAAAGSVTKDMSGVVLTGLTNNLVVRQASALNGGSSANFSFVGTAVGQATTAGGVNVEFFDGGWIVPPGGVIALQATTTPVAHSAVSGLLWGEEAV